MSAWLGLLQVTPIEDSKSGVSTDANLSRIEQSRVVWTVFESFLAIGSVPTWMIVILWYKPGYCCLFSACANWHDACPAVLVHRACSARTDHTLLILSREATESTWSSCTLSSTQAPNFTARNYYGSSMFQCTANKVSCCPEYACYGCLGKLF